jgi:hypothetical protein
MEISSGFGDSSVANLSAMVRFVSRKRPMLLDFFEAVNQGNNPDMGALRRIMADRCLALRIRRESVRPR